MEPQYSVLIYSKYSPNCKKLIDMMNESGVDFGSALSLQNLCIDNEKIRKRIQQTKEIEVTVVPCILTIFQSGGVEKYDGSFAFKWTEAMISQLAPPPPPRQLPPPPPPQPAQQQPQQVEEDYEYEPEPREPAPLPPRPKERSRRRRRRQAPHQQEPLQQEPLQPQGPPSRMHKIERKSVTSVDDLQFDEEESGRNRLPPPVRRIRQDQASYIEDDSLFGGDQVSMREVASAIKSSTKAQGNDIMARAQAMQQNRDDDEQTIMPQQNRPSAARRP